MKKTGLHAFMISLIKVLDELFIWEQSLKR